MPFLNDEVREWIALELRGLGVEDLAVYALEAGTEGDERRVVVATEIGLLDHRYAPYGSSARYRLAMLLYPWQVLRGVELRADTFRLWAREHRTRWSFTLHHPHFEAATETTDLGQALCDFARVCAVMAEPFGVPAGRASSEVPRAHSRGPQPLKAVEPVDMAAAGANDVEADAVSVTEAGAESAGPETTIKPGEEEVALDTGSTDGEQPGEEADATIGAEAGAPTRSDT